VRRQWLDDGLTLGQSQFRHFYEPGGAGGASWPESDRNEGPRVRSAQHEHPTQGSRYGPALEIKPGPEAFFRKF
jgi:hypothetical protein